MMKARGFNKRVWLVPGMVLLLAACATPEVDTGAAQESVVEDASEDAAADEAAEVTKTEPMAVVGGDVDITSGGQAYASYQAAPDGGGPYPGIVLIHSFRGLEQGYRDMVDRFAAEGFVVLAVGWQTFEKSPFDDTVAQLVLDSVTYLDSREDVDSDRLGLTGFCAGGRYTMLLLPQYGGVFKSGVAWYGFPYSGQTEPASLAGDLDVPMLMIHGTDDQPSPIEDIHRYAEELDAAGATYELEVYEDEPHGFMLEGGQLREDDVANDAFARMVEFFKRTLA